MPEAAAPGSGQEPAPAAGARFAAAEGGERGERPCRLCLMLPRFSLYGGVEQFGYRLASALAARGHEVDFICARKEAEAPEGVRLIAVGRPPGFKVLKMLWFLIRAEQARRKGGYDLCLSLGKTWNQDISRMGGGPLKVFWEKSGRALPPGLPRLANALRRRLSPANVLTLLLEKRQFTRQSEVIAVSHLVRDWLLRAHPALDPDKVHVIYNRPDTSRFFPPPAGERATARQALASALGFPPPEDAVLIGTASTNFRLKGVEPLIRAMALLPDKALLIVAGGRDHAAYAAVARSLGLEKRVFFPGRVEDMPAFYRALDIFILPTFYDACSNAVLEALASGCAVISGKDNGSAFFLPEEALLPDPGDVADLARTLRLHMERPAPPPFVWPEAVESGIEAFVERLERRLRGRCGGGGKA